MAQNTSDEKKNIRSACRAKRDAMSPAQAADLSQRICAHLTASDLFAQAQYIYAYAPLGNEADLRPAVLAAWQEGKRVAFPKVCGEEMRFFEVTDLAQLASGAFGIEEPYEAAGAVPVDWRERGDLLVLVPGVAFDWQGHRMGFGKGFYDRHFAACDSDGAEHSPGAVTLLGALYAFQIADSLPTEAHDLTVSYLVTEEGLEQVI